MTAPDPTTPPDVYVACPTCDAVNPKLLGYCRDPWHLAAMPKHETAAREAVAELLGHTESLEVGGRVADLQELPPPTSENLATVREALTLGITEQKLRDAWVALDALEQELAEAKRVSAAHDATAFQEGLKRGRDNRDRKREAMRAERDAAQAELAIAQRSAKAWEADAALREQNHQDRVAELAQAREALDDALTSVAVYSAAMRGASPTLSELEERLHRALAGGEGES